jgi:hypothetical protein
VSRGYNSAARRACSVCNVLGLVRGYVGRYETGRDRTGSDDSIPVKRRPFRVGKLENGADGPVA